MKKILLIAGATASGKSAYAMRLAKQYNGVVINADSMQVYRDLRILSARPSLDDEAHVEHQLYGFVDATQEYSVGDYLADAQACLLEVQAQEKTPIFVGGTGLYFKALTQGMIATPPIPKHIRVRLEAEASEGVDLHAQLILCDKETALRLSPLDTVRIIRALEVIEATGQSITHWQKTANSQPILPQGIWRGLFLNVERDVLKQRIHTRFEAMIGAGALDEIAALIALDLSVNRGIMKAHGVPHLVAYMQGKLALNEAIALAQMDTRRYAKRQRTFARGQLSGFEWVNAVTNKDYELA